MMCWHRPGNLLRATVTCRFCGVAIEYCPCVDGTFRRVDDRCELCLGSMWVAVVRGFRAKFAEYLENRV